MALSLKKFELSFSKMILWKKIVKLSTQSYISAVAPGNEILLSKVENGES
jgi:hypothetical protein